LELVDFPARPTPPPRGGVLDLGLLSMSKTPCKGGGLELGFPNRPDPEVLEGGVLESD